jgi:hypothetical protein
MDEARRLLEGAVDTHVRSSPDLVARNLDYENRYPQPLLHFDGEGEPRPCPL